MKGGETVGNRGFTLLELMVVVGVLAILMLAAVPYFLGAQEDAEANNALRDVKTLEDAAMQEYVKPGVDGWDEMTNETAEFDFEDAEADNLDAFGVDISDGSDGDLYTFDEDFVDANVQRLYNDDELEGYGLVVGGEYEGYVFILEPVNDSDGVEHIHLDFSYDPDENGED